ncbi:MAG TPA: dTDP-4-dehydrorhamnose reductase [Actinomycetota bacterium]|nr:dTDP-4-dehydrorhamnose reductase [Actinomycetota bacterium]
MRIAVTGAGGGLGTAFREAAPTEDVVAFGHGDLPVEDLDRVAERLVAVRPDVVLHLAAKTSVDGCEEDPEGAYVVNALGTLAVARAARDAGALLVALSTDYVFDGEKDAPYDEVDAPNPLSVYGRSKLWGERLAAAAAPEHLVIRTSWVFGAGSDFVSAAVRKLASGEAVGGIVDQIGTPTYVHHLAERLLPAIRSGHRGVVHLAGPQPTTWFDVLATAREVGGLPGEVVEQKAADLGRPAPRPSNSALASRVLPGLDVAPMPPLEDAVREVVDGVR